MDFKPMPETVENSMRNEELKELLLALRQEMLAEIKKSMGENMKEKSRLSFELLKDNADKSVDDLLKHVNAEILNNKSDVLDKTDEAITKLEEGTYGVCEECGCEIPVKRLSVIPFAAFCVDCQSTKEKK